MIPIVALTMLLLAADPNRPHWRDDNRCGANSLLMFVRYHGGLPFDEIINDALPIHHEGNSLAELQMASQHAGVRAEAVHLEISDLANGRVTLPCIAHWQEQRGHFVMVVACDHQSITIADPTALTTGVMSHADFARAWSGWLLVVEPTIRRMTFWFVAGIFFAISASLFFRKRPTTAVIVLCFVNIGCGSKDAVAREVLPTILQYPLPILVFQGGPAPIAKERWGAIVEKFRSCVRIDSISGLAHFAIVWKRKSKENMYSRMAQNSMAPRCLKYSFQARRTRYSKSTGPSRRS